MNHSQDETPAAAMATLPQEQTEEPVIIDVDDDNDNNQPVISHAPAGVESTTRPRMTSSFFASTTFSKHFQLTSTTDETHSKDTNSQAQQTQAQAQQTQQESATSIEKEQPPWPSQHQPWVQQIWHSLTYSYMHPILVKGKRQFQTNQQHLVLEDLYQTPHNMTATVLVQQFW